MTKAVWFNCCAGVAGDMLLASLIDAGADPMAVTDAWAALGVDGYAATWERVQRCGVSALWTNLVVDDHDHDHATITTDDHGHDHHAPTGGRGDRADLVVRVARAGSSSTPSPCTGRWPRSRARSTASHPTPSSCTRSGHSIRSSTWWACAPRCRRSASTTSATPRSPSATAACRTAHGCSPIPCRRSAACSNEPGRSRVGIDTGDGAGDTDRRGAAHRARNGVRTDPGDDDQRQPVSAPEPPIPPAGPNVVQAVVGLLADAGQDSSGRPARLIEANVDDVTGEVLAHTIAELLDGRRLRRVGDPDRDEEGAAGPHGARALRRRHVRRRAGRDAGRDRHARRARDRRRALAAARASTTRSSSAVTRSGSSSPAGGSRSSTTTPRPRPARSACRCASVLADAESLARSTGRGSR